MLDRDGEALQRTQKQQAAADDQRRPQHDVQPQRRREQVLDQAGEADHAERQDKDAEHRRPIAGIVAAEGEAADGAVLGDLQEAFEQTAPAASRASPPQAEAGREREPSASGGDSQRSALPQ